MKRLIVLVLVLLLLWPHLSWAAGAFVQVKSLGTDATSATTIAVTTDSNITQNNLLAVGFAWGTSDVTATCAGSRTGSMAVVDKNWDVDRGGFGMCYGVVPSTGAETVTITFGSSVAFRGLCICEYSGVRTNTPLDSSDYKHQDTPGTGSNAITTDNFTVAVNNALIFTFSAIAITAGAYTAGTNYTKRNTEDAGTDTISFGCGDRLNVTAGTHAATWTHNQSGVDTQTGAMAFFDTTSAAAFFLRRQAGQ